MPRFWLCGALLLAIAGLATSQQILNVNNFTSPFLLSSNDVPLVDNSANGVNVCTAQNDHIATDFTTAVKAAFYNRMICPFGIPIIAHQNVPDANIIYTANILGRFLDKNM